MSYKSDIGGDEVYDGDGVGNSDGDGDNDNDGDGDGDGDNYGDCDGDGDGEDNHLQIIRHALIAQKYVICLETWAPYTRHLVSVSD